MRAVGLVVVVVLALRGAGVFAWWARFTMPAAAPPQTCFSESFGFPAVVPWPLSTVPGCVAASLGPDNCRHRRLNVDRAITTAVSSAAPGAVRHLCLRRACDGAVALFEHHQGCGVHGGELEGEQQAP